jgi:hypothetical protein
MKINSLNVNSKNFGKMCSNQVVDMSAKSIVNS